MSTKPLFIIGLLLFSAQISAGEIVLNNIIIIDVNALKLKPNVSIVITDNTITSIESGDFTSQNTDVGTNGVRLKNQWGQVK